MPTRWPSLGALLILALAPLVLLGPCLFGDRTFLPFDLAQFPPASVQLSPEQRREILDQPAHHDTTEIPVLVVPEMELAREEFDAGRFPAWNPYARFGAPLFANSLAAMVYPPNWVCLILGDPSGGLGIAAYLSFLIAGVLMYALLREMRLRESAALFGALAFAFGGTLATNAHFYMRMNALIWLPGMLLGCLRIAHTHGRARLPGTMGLAICTAMAFLAGFPPFAFVSTLIAALFSLILIVRQARTESGVLAVRLAGWLLFGALLGMAAAGVQLVPMLRYFAESNRTVEISLDAMNNQGFATMGFLGYLLPDAFGHPNGAPLANPAPGFFDHLRWGYPESGLPPYDKSALAYALFDRTSWADGSRLLPHYNYTEYAVFPGTLTLLLLAVGIARRGTGLRWPAAIVLLAMWVLAYAPSWLQFVYAMPGFANVPPIRYVGGAAVLVAALAAMGFETIAARTHAGRAVTVVAAAGVLLGIVLAAIAMTEPLGDTKAVIDSLGAKYHDKNLTPDAIASHFDPAGGDTNLASAGPRLTSNLWRAAIASILAGAWLWLWERSRHNRAWFPAMTASVIALTFAELALLAQPLTRGRTLPASENTAIHDFLRERRAALATAGGITVARAAKSAKIPTDLPPGTLFPERIRDLNAYAFADQWSHRPFVELYGAEQSIRGLWPKALPDDDRLGRPFFDLIGLRYLLSTDELDHAGKVVGPPFEGPGGSFYVYERPNPLPRALVVHELRELDDDAAITAMLAPDFDPRAAVLVGADAALALGELDPTELTAQGRRSVQFDRDDPGEVHIRVAPGRPGYLVLCDADMSGWSATVDGTPAAIARGNLFMRVVKLPERGVEVRYSYVAPGLTAGTWLTATALLGMLAMATAFLRSRHQVAPVES